MSSHSRHFCPRQVNSRNIAADDTQSPERQIFFDPQRKRWKRPRRILDAAAVLFTLVMAGFIFNVLHNQHLPELLLPVPKHN